MPTSVLPHSLLSSRNYPGFLGALFLVLLRIAIGWHFLYRGARQGRVDPPRASSRSRPRSTCGTRPARSPRISAACCPTSTAWPCSTRPGSRRAGATTSSGSTKHYSFDRRAEGQGQGAPREERRSGPTIWFSNIENDEKRREVLQRAREVQAVERNPDAMSFERERAWEVAADPRRRPQEADRPIVAPTARPCADAVTALATPEQQAAAGPVCAALDVRSTRPTS